jgi:hypothetical protein
MSDDETLDYDDGRIVCDDDGLLIRRYYPWGDKRVAYAQIKSVDVVPLTGVRAASRWPIWGSGDFHWWNYDPQRPAARRTARSGRPARQTTHRLSTRFSPHANRTAEGRSVGTAARRAARTGRRCQSGPDSRWSKVTQRARLGG